MSENDKSNLRYTIGKCYIFMLAPNRNFDIDTKLSNYYEFIKVICKEHHKVSWEHDPENIKKYDGFIFEEIRSSQINEPGRIYYNQYPRASYGQLDDSCNRIITRKITDEEYELWNKNKNKNIDELNRFFLDYYLLINDPLIELYNLINKKNKKEFENEFNQLQTKLKEFDNSINISFEKIIINNKEHNVYHCIINMDNN